MRLPWVSRRRFELARYRNQLDYADLSKAYKEADELVNKLQFQLARADAKMEKINILVVDAKRQVTLHGADPVLKIDDIETILM